MNHEALRLTALTGVMLGCEIAPTSTFERKNYFYPDMPKNYQISQYRGSALQKRWSPVAWISLSERHSGQAGGDRENRALGSHPSGRGCRQEFSSGENNTAIDFNRAGTPLMEIVTHPEIHSPKKLWRF